MCSIVIQDRVGSKVNGAYLSDNDEELVDRPQSSQSVIGGRRKSVQFSSRPTIVFDSASKSYGKHHILRNLNITVNENTIYGLFGSSGSGKTTAMACLLGIEKLDAGNIYVRGVKTQGKGSRIPGKRIGYMPQTLSLNEEFTLKEVLHYFGKIYGMSYHDVEDKRKYFIGLLRLESCKEQIRHMSEDQRHLVSFSVALLHQPEILVMDEPTIGMDLLSRERIWTQVNDLVSESSITVVVATSCVNEANKVHKVGILRHGRVLVEESPSTLITKFDTISLEDALVQICFQNDKDESSQNRWNSIDVVSKEDESNRNSLPGKAIAAILRQSSWNVGKRDLTQSHDRLQALFLKNLLVTYRNLWLVLFLLVLPPVTIYLTSTCVIFPPKNLNFGIINQELNKLYNETIPCDSDKCNNSTMSWKYLQNFDSESFTLSYFNTEADAMEMMLNGSIWGYLSISSNFTREIEFANVHTDYGDKLHRSPALVKVSLDTSDSMVAIWLKSFIYSNFYAFLYNSSGTPSGGKFANQIKLLFEPAKFGLKDDSIIITPVVTLQVLSFFSSLTSALAFMYERKRGIFKRITTVGVLQFEIVLSHFSILLFLLLAQTTISFIVMFYFFNVPQVGSFLLAYTLVIIYGISAFCAGILIGTICHRKHHAILVLLAVSFPTVILSGIFSPLEGFPWHLRYTGYVYPGILPGLALRNILLRGWGLNHLWVWLGFVSCFATSSLYLIIFMLLSI